MAYMPLRVTCTYSECHFLESVLIQLQWRLQNIVWGRTGKPGVLQSMGMQRAGHGGATLTVFTQVSNYSMGGMGCFSFNLC